jgi:enterochelin esterase-like enzyme
MAAIGLSRTTLGLGRAAAVVLAVAVVAWIAAGLGGGYVYLHRYNLYRGFPKPVTPAGVATGTLRKVSFRSAATGRTEHYGVYLPPGYAAAAAQGKRFPVLYLLHGVPGNMNAFTNIGAADVRANVLIASHAIRPMIMVMPAGLEGRADSEWANTAAGPWEKFVIDVVHDVDHRFATFANRQHRGIAGDSEGAYAAVNITLQHLGMFSVVESWSGYYTQSPAGPFAHATLAQLRANSPAKEVRGVAPEIRRLGLRAWLYEGRADMQNPAGVESFGAKLDAAGAEVHVGFFPGGHDWGLWRAQLPRMLRAASHWFGQRPVRGGRLSLVGHAVSPARRLEIMAARHRRCLALHYRPGMRLKGTCRALRRSHGLSY